MRRYLLRRVAITERPYSPTAERPRSLPASTAGDILPPLTRARGTRWYVALVFNRFPIFTATRDISRALYFVSMVRPYQDRREPSHKLSLAPPSSPRCRSFSGAIKRIDPYAVRFRRINARCAAARAFPNLARGACIIANDAPIRWKNVRA